ncbi:hypothetical protein B0H16DRAFT_1459507 [Mycena metata]|uniref:Uncharacterized protein n=1 Tax=Mycena metata TaxID=1033252 RepID=A0AAD7IYG8_9AGAR|nr:hypothetical protein B0H16DRAFT_1459507 [Mycena metata]
MPLGPRAQTPKETHNVDGQCVVGLCPKPALAAYAVEAWSLQTDFGQQIVEKVNTVNTLSCHSLRSYNSGSTKSGVLLMLHPQRGGLKAAFPPCCGLRFSVHHRIAISGNAVLLGAALKFMFDDICFEILPGTWACLAMPSSVPVQVEIETLWSGSMTPIIECFYQPCEECPRATPQCEKTTNDYNTYQMSSRPGIHPARVPRPRVSRVWGSLRIFELLLLFGFCKKLCSSVGRSPFLHVACVKNRLQPFMQSICREIAFHGSACPWWTGTPTDNKYQHNCCGGKVLRILWSWVQVPTCWDLRISMLNLWGDTALRGAARCCTALHGTDARWRALAWRTVRCRAVNRAKACTTVLVLLFHSVASCSFGLLVSLATWDLSAALLLIELGEYLLRVNEQGMEVRRNIVTGCARGNSGRRCLTLGHANTATAATARHGVTRLFPGARLPAADEVGSTPCVRYERHFLRGSRRLRPLEAGRNCVAWDKIVLAESQECLKEGGRRARCTAAQFKYANLKQCCLATQFTAGIDDGPMGATCLWEDSEAATMHPSEHEVEQQNTLGEITVEARKVTNVTVM